MSQPPASYARSSPLAVSFKQQTFLLPSKSKSRVSQFLPIPKSGACRAELRGTVSSKIVVREAQIMDYWEMAEIHVSSFNPGYSFPSDFLLRLDRLEKELTFSPPHGQRVSRLVAVIDSSVDDIKNFITRGLFGKFSLNRGVIAGVLTVNSYAYALPKEGSSQQNWNTVAYISSVAVGERFRRKGVAKALIAKAEAKARSWGCHAMVLHYDINNYGATMLYKGQGFECIKEPGEAYWPFRGTFRGIKTGFMVKLLRAPTAEDLRKPSSSTVHRRKESKDPPLNFLFYLELLISLCMSLVHLHNRKCFYE